MESWLRSAETHKFLPPPSPREPLSATASEPQHEGSKFALKPSKLKVPDRPSPSTAGDVFNLMTGLTLREPFSATDHSTTARWNTAAFSPTPTPLPSNHCSLSNNFPTQISRGVRLLNGFHPSNSCETLNGLRPPQGDFGSLNGFAPRKRLNGWRDAAVATDEGSEGQSAKETGRYGVKRTVAGTHNTRSRCVPIVIVTCLFVSIVLNAVLISPYLHKYFYS